MISELAIKNYKSALNLSIPLTRLNILIGENGAGKSNLLEALVLAAAAASGKLDTEYLIARGVRLTGPRLMRSAFNATTRNQPIQIKIETVNAVTKEKDREYRFVLSQDSNSQTNEWTLDPKSEFPTFGPANFLTTLWERTYAEKPNTAALAEFQKVANLLGSTLEGPPGSKKKKTIKISGPVAQILGTIIGKFKFERFTVYSPNYETLRNHLIPSPTSPIGPRGEGLLASLSTLENQEPNRYQDIIESLSLFGWYKSIKISTKSKSNNEFDSTRMEILDRHIKSRGIGLSELSVNEGFFYVLFYMTLVCHPSTPQIFAIENIETSLNPKLCEAVVKRIYHLAKKHDKQVIITTHNPSVLDALNLDDPDQSLILIRRNLDGHTIGNAYKKPLHATKGDPIKLSEAFLRGHIGGLSKVF